MEFKLSNESYEIIKKHTHLKDPKRTPLSGLNNPEYYDLPENTILQRILKKYSPKLALALLQKKNWKINLEENKNYILPDHID